ncbi:COP9 signalosome complex subunit 5a-like [Pyrus ussuriensis x Pyrus communis]|uniref:COP9 signalosome complex subunit 5 n=1 Tax=Pyrus ussuriensis x Pyrus communis TaxID=2448454 RepID=A0A5N5H1F0_9ROSA|nr:COP9 signalosome complex subunit 5a-like [Pyrus ussuriensis x Pyrus communis]
MDTPPNVAKPKVDTTADAIFYYDEPWANDPHYFKRVKISALALLKMVVHARSGGTIEVMGLMQGKTDGDAIIVMDAFALRVEGTETRVNAQADAYEYMVEFSQTNKQGGWRMCGGWYHSHPGYGCWLSGIDVSHKMLNQQYQEPFLAVVIDPTRTDIPKGYIPPDESVSEYQTIPLNKIEDFGVHCKTGYNYYSLDITYFKSSLDTHLEDAWSRLLQHRVLEVYTQKHNHSHFQILITVNLILIRRLRHGFLHLHSSLKFRLHCYKKLPQPPLYSLSAPQP